MNFRSTLAVAIFVLVAATIAAVTYAQQSEQFAADILIQAKAPTVRPECTMGPPQIQKSDARRIA